MLICVCECVRVRVRVCVQGTVIYKLFGGQRTVFAVSDSGDVYAFGNNDFGMLGTGDMTPRSTPSLVDAFVGKNVYEIAAGAYHTLAITGCWELADPCTGDPPPPPRLSLTHLPTVFARRSPPPPFPLGISAPCMRAEIGNRTMMIEERGWLMNE